MSSRIQHPIMSSRRGIRNSSPARQFNAGGKIPKFSSDFSENRFTESGGGGKSFYDLYEHSATSVATMTNSSGEIVWRPHNLVAESESFTTGWTLSGSTLSDSEDSPSSNMVAKKLTEDGTTGLHRIFETVPTLNFGSVSFSVFVKAVERSIIYLRMTKTSGSTAHVWFDVSSGAKLTEEAGISGSIVDFGDGWYLCTVSVDDPNNGNSNPLIGLSTADNSASYTGDSSSGVLISGAHFYRSDLGGMAPIPANMRDLATSSTYVATTTTARYLPRVGHHKYDGTAWVNKGYLHESEARTNLFTQSVASALTGLTTSGVAVGLGGWDNGLDNVFNFSSGVTAWVYSQPTVTAQPYTLSCIVECGDGLEPSFGSSSASDASNEFAFVLNGATIPPTDYQTTSLGAGLWFVWGVATATAGTGNCGVLKYNTNISDTLKVSAVQVEAGSIPSSLIVTLNNTATRAAETLTGEAGVIPWATLNYETGAELVTNGGFDADSDWDKLELGTTSNPPTISGGVATIERVDGTNFGYLAQTLSLTEGNIYEITLDISGTDARVRIGDSALGTQALNVIEANANTTASYQFVARASNVLTLISGTNGVDVIIDNISVKELRSDYGVSIAMKGEANFADTGTVVEAGLYSWEADVNNYIYSFLDTSGGNTGRVQFRQTLAGAVDLVLTGADQYTPGLNVAYNIASYHQPNGINGAVDGTALTENTTPTALVDLSATDIEIGYDYMGTIESFAMWPVAIQDAGIEEATS